MPVKVLCDVIIKFRGFERVYFVGQVFLQNYDLLRPLVNNPHVVQFFYYLRFFSSKPCRGPQMTTRNFITVYRRYYGNEVICFLEYLEYNIPVEALRNLCHNHVICPEAIELNMADLPIGEKVRRYFDDPNIPILREVICRRLMNYSVDLLDTITTYIPPTTRPKKARTHRATLHMVHLLLAISDGYYDAYGIRPVAPATNDLLRALRLIKIGR